MSSENLKLEYSVRERWLLSMCNPVSFFFFFLFWILRIKSPRKTKGKLEFFEVSFLFFPFFFWGGEKLVGIYKCFFNYHTRLCQVFNSSSYLRKVTLFCIDFISYCFLSIINACNVPLCAKKRQRWPDIFYRVCFFFDLHRYTRWKVSLQKRAALQNRGPFSKIQRATLPCNSVLKYTCTVEYKTCRIHSR